jgi:hypothetical protein
MQTKEKKEERIRGENDVQGAANKRASNQRLICSLQGEWIASLSFYSCSSSCWRPQTSP